MTQMIMALLKNGLSLIEEKHIGLIISTEVLQLHYGMKLTVICSIQKSPMMERPLALIRLRLKSGQLVPVNLPTMPWLGPFIGRME
jgi:hypothetical protein